MERNKILRKAKILFLVLFCYSSVQSQIVDRIYSNYNGYWTSGTGSINSVQPDNTHELIGFRFDGKVYSTGVSDSTLSAHVPVFSPGIFKSFPVKDIPFTDGGSRFFGFGQMVDGINNGVDVVNHLPFTKPGKLSYILTSGKQGLNLGSAATNIPANAEALTFSIALIHNLTLIGDGFPDIIVTQMAQPNSVYDSIYFEDINGKVVGNKLTINFNDNSQTPVLGKWKIDFFNPVSGAVWEKNGVRDMRLWARDISAFGINSTNAGDVVALRYKLKGSSDPAFLAYNSELMTVIGAVDDQTSINANNSIDIDVLQNDSYRSKESISLSILKNPKNGTVSVNTDKTIKYTPNTGFIEVDTFKYQLCDNYTSICDSATVIVHVKNYWYGTSGTDWGVPSNWTAGFVPEAGDNVEFATVGNNGTAAINDLHLDIDRTIKNLTNLSAKKLVIDVGKELTVNGKINTGSNNRILIKAGAGTANGSLVFPNEPGSVFGSVEMYSKAWIGAETNENEKYRWQYFGIPVTNITASPTFDGSYVRIWDEAKQTTTVGKQWTSLNNNSTMRSFQGYEITHADARTFTISGQLVNRDLDTTLTATSGSFYSGQHVLANPYTASINVKDINFGTGMEQTVYIFNTGSFTDWETGTGLSGTVFNEAIVPGQYVSIPKHQAGYVGTTSIPSMQGFLVKLADGHTSGNLKIKYSSIAGKNTELQRAPQETQPDDDKISITIDLYSEHRRDRLWIFSEDNCTPGFDNGWDGFKMLDQEKNAQIFVSSQGENYQVASTNDFNGTYLGFSADGDETNYTLRILNKNISLKYKTLYLLDLKTNKVEDITKSEKEIIYHFEASNTSPENRFLLITQSINTNDNDSIIVFSNGKGLYAHNISNKEGQLIVYDATGRLLTTQQIAPYEVKCVSNIFASGIYIIKKKYSDINLSTDKIIIK